MNFRNLITHPHDWATSDDELQALAARLAARFAAAEPKQQEGAPNADD